MGGIAGFQAQPHANMHGRSPLRPGVRYDSYGSCLAACSNPDRSIMHVHAHAHVHVALAIAIALLCTPSPTALRVCMYGMYSMYFESWVGLGTPARRIVYPIQVT